MKAHGWLMPALLAAFAVSQANAQSTADDKRFPLPPADWPAPVMDRQVVPYFLFDLLEYRLLKGNNAQAWDAQASIGTDYDKFWAKSEGEKTVGGRTEQADLQLLYARLISPFWYVQAGVRNDARPGPSRNYGVLAIQGLAPYRFNVSGSLFVRGGEIAGRFEAEYDQKITQRLILQPRAETNFSSSSDRARGLGGGLRDVELGLRLRYEIAREIAPYIGLNWQRKLGGTASAARQDGDSVTSRGMVVGLRLWY